MVVSDITTGALALYLGVSQELVSKDTALYRGF
jgi:hypothetical protein